MVFLTKNFSRRLGYSKTLTELQIIHSHAIDNMESFGSKNTEENVGVSTKRDQ